MKHNLHNSIPNWMIAAVVKTTCNECNQPLIKENILGLGVKEVKDGKVSIFVEYQCSNCKHSARMNFSSQTGTAEDVCYLLLDEIHKKRRLDKSQHIESPAKTKTKMTDDETKKFIQSMNDSETFEDFLKLIGALNLVENENNNDNPKA